jgi:hypothetical protein
VFRVVDPREDRGRVVALPSGERISPISLYGLLDERSDAAVHRSLSELTPLLEDGR